jgi:Tol biopolymer transport system component
VRFRVVAPVIVALSLAACGVAGSAGQGSDPVANNGGPAAAGSGTMLIIKGDNVFSMSADGKSDTQITHETNSNFANNPVYSPDGSLIAYTHHIAPVGDQWGGAELHVMKADGSDDRTLVPAKAKGERAETPTWTPDGQAIYYAHDVPIIDDANRYTGDTLTIDKVEVTSGDSQTVVKDAILPAISRSGAFVWVNYSVNDSSFQMNIGNLDGSEPRTLLTDKDFQAVWSPVLSADGKTIVFGGSGRTSTKVGSIGGTIAAALNPLVPGRAEAHGLPWDPWIINADGTGLKKLASIGSDEMAMAWSPDEQEIVFSNLSSTYIMRADGGGLTRLLSRGDPGGISWRAA